MNPQEQTEYLKDAIKLAGQNAAFGVSIAEDLIKDATTLLNILLAGVGGGIGLCLQLLNSSHPMGLALVVAICSLYLAAIAVVVVKQCLMSADLYPPTNSPENLLVAAKEPYKNEPTEQIYQWVLESMDAPCQKNTQRNHTRAYWLDRCRIAAALTPVVFIVGLAVFWASR